MAEIKQEALVEVAVAVDAAPAAAAVAVAVKAEAPDATDAADTTEVSAEAPALTRRVGEAPVKKEYLKPIPQKTEAPPASADGGEGGEDGESGGNRKMRGTFKKRPIDAQEDPAEMLCRPIAAGESCPFGDSCKFSHDMGDYMKRKEKDLGESCPVFDAVGFCRYGLACRFAGAHVMKSEGGTYKNIVDESKKAIAAAAAAAGGVHFECNELTNDVRNLLRKNKYPFKAIGMSRKGQRNQKGGKGKNDQQKQEQQQKQQQHESAADAEANADEAQDAGKEAQATEPSAFVEPASESPLLAERKPVDFKRKIYIAPLTTVGNLPFRRLMKQTGADITCGEMAMATNLLRAQQSEWALLRRHESEDVFGVQIAGGFGDQMARVCELIAREANVDFIDINMGCPIDIACSSGAGASLMTRPPKVQEVISASLTGIELGSIGRANVPGLTVKLRTGWSDKERVAHKLVPKIQATRASNPFMNASVVQDYKLRALQGVDAITVHGRSRLQRYTKNADWDYVFDCSDAQESALSRVPFVGGGDVLSYEEFDAHLQNGKLDTCMIARGALIKPWLPTEIKERRHWDISASERLDLLKDFVKFGLEHWGSDQKGVNRTRRYLLEWQSFLCRYIPVGLLEVLPQRINDRPSPYYGRNDLETLMASDQAVDWVKISEMLLGPVPEGFQFVPKHKANAYG